MQMGENVRFVEIYAPSLCEFTSMSPKWFDKKKEDFDYSIKVCGAKIAEFKLESGYPENIIMIGSTVASANLMGDTRHRHLSLGDCGLQLRKLLRELSDVKYLSMLGILPAIGLTKLGLPLPKFYQLKKLRLDIRFNAEGMLELLHAAPFLKFLVIAVHEDKEYDYDSVEPVPSCVVHHLEEVTFDYTQCLPLDSKYLVEEWSTTEDRLCQESSQV